MIEFLYRETYILLCTIKYRTCHVIYDKAMTFLQIWVEILSKISLKIFLQLIP